MCEPLYLGHRMAAQDTAGRRIDILVLPCGDALKQQVRKQVNRVVVLDNGKNVEWSIHTTMWPHLGMACV